jgi:predicted nucleic acid-binding protein
MSQPPVPLFIDTGAFFARFNQRAAEHDRARAVFQGIREGELQYGPLITSRYVLSEFATLMRRKVGHPPAVNALETIRSAESINVLPLGSGAFDRSCERFARYDARRISSVDHSTGVLADDYDIEHISTFDTDDFHTLGFVVVPADTGDS